MFCLRGFGVFISCVVLLIVHATHGSEIIGGKEVQPHSLPFMALLKSNTHKCGGILIDPEWVLTAAHCSDMKTVLLGVHSVKEKEKDSRQVRDVGRNVPHPSYNKEDNANDLRLLKLATPVTKTKTVKWLKLGKPIKEPAAGTRCLVAGWGLIKQKPEQKSKVLMSVNVSVIDRVTCNSGKYYNHNPVITSDMICAGSTNKEQAGTCKGDSGGPLLCNGALVGVTSFGRRICGKIPGVFSFLSAKQLRWIKETMKSPKYNE
ncbi:granzyme K-like [Brachyistius frenatus]|uniref:granzyme K-like n=1 Tax=Brachyistius frenatus TaxID=100188 RepID=UPI0037E947E9